MNRSLTRLAPLSLAALAALGFACQTSALGTCTSTASCTKGSVCDVTQSPPVCVVPEKSNIRFFVTISTVPTPLPSSASLASAS